ncbi:GTP 3',8-cyclase MoaA [Microbulbifer yueqingensis]|uniref:GTP 3',8-cyclase n=1 Tax=Microbulbifer yueqingensis TaxID=658219 RepID=A0A1G8XLS0_9GAMM|nr:GTP 3',8-cyclase MoaA [Microbulbifer yueqingensis]SDJ91521.1 cyclic pyranopterin phosphate synthase [Microbulbifer yueqingensis]
MLIDNYGRRFYYLRLSVTDACNFRCSYCLPDGYSAGDDSLQLSSAEAATVVRAFASLGTQKVRLTGGEPSLRSDLPEIIAASKATPGIRRVAVTSNGYKLPRVVDGWHAAGLDQLNISIDSLDPAEFAELTGHDCLPRVLQGIARAQQLGIEVKVNAVLLQDGSRRRLREFLSWIREMPVTVRFIELMRTGENKAYFASNHLRGQVIEHQLLEDGWQLLPRARDAGPAREYRHPAYRGRIGLITPYGEDFCNSCNRLRISAQGRLHLCLFADHGIDLYREISRGDSRALAEKIQRAIGEKPLQHHLDQGQVGAMRNLSQLGG